MNRRAAVAAAAVALVTAASASAGSGPDKAGGRGQPSKPVGKPVTLVLATSDRAFGGVRRRSARLSGGTIRIDVQVGRLLQANYERFTVEDVRRKAQLGSVAARVQDTMGATSMRALVAPLLVDSLALQRRVLESPIAAQMLAGLDSAGVVGLALTPGPLRRPVGVARPLRGPQDYRGATIGIKFGGVARSTFKTLGAEVKGYTRGQAQFDGAELDLKTIADAGYDPRAKEITANVVLWPRPQTVFANRAAFARLTRWQRGSAAGRSGSHRTRATRVEKEQRDALSVIWPAAPTCSRRHPRRARALRRALRPVYAELDRDPQTKQLIAAIRKLRGPTPQASRSHAARARPTRLRRRTLAEHRQPREARPRRDG
jgi:TRAP-type C4-dicarboxylate transport system substrate-binding protein